MFNTYQPSSSSNSFVPAFTLSHGFDVVATMWPVVRLMKALIASSVNWSIQYLRFIELLHHFFWESYIPQTAISPAGYLKGNTH
jgi:hypothetical protein